MGKRIISTTISILVLLSCLLTSCHLEVSGTGAMPEGWCEDIRLSSIEGDRMPQICANGSNIHLVWNGGAQYERINYKRSIDGGNTWDLEVQIPNVIGVVNGANGIAVSGDYIHLVWENGATIMYAKSENNGETWSIPETLAMSSADDGYASIAVNASYVHVAFGRYYSTSEYNQIFYIRSTDYGNSWSDIVPISPQNEFSKDLPDIAVSGNYVHVVWHEHDDAVPYTVSEVRYVRSTDRGENWEEDYALVPGSEVAHIPAIASRESNVHLIWAYDDDIYHKKSLDNGFTWSGDAKITDEGWASLFGGDIGLYGVNVHVAWYDYRDSVEIPEIYYKLSNDNGNSWTPDTRLTYLITNPELPGSYDPKIAVAGNSIHVVWQYWEHTTWDNHVYYKRTLPNILPTSIQLSNNPTEEHTVIINATINNNGYADAYNVNVTCFINDTLLSNQIINLLELNVPQTVQFQWTPLDSGNYNIRIEVDPNNASYEWDETDNNLTQAVYINAIPIASLNANLEVYTGETANFDASASYDDGTIVSYYFDFGDGNSSGWISSPTKTYSYPSSGIYTASLIVKDNNGIESTNTAEVPINVMNRPPSVEINYPTGGEVSGLVTITGTSSDPDGDVERVYVKIDGNTWVASGTTSWSHDWDTTQYSNEEHIISARAYDGEDYSDETHVHVMVDNGGNIAPQVGITYPNNGDTVSGEIEITGTASDDNAVTLVQVVFDDLNGPWYDAVDTSDDGSWSTWALIWDTTQYDNGQHFIYAIAEDDLGLDSQQKSIRVIVDNGGNIPPSVEITSHSGGEVVSGEIKIKGTALDHDGNLELVEIKIDDGNWDTATGKTSWTYTWDTTTYSNGEHLIYSRAKDDADEYSQIKSVTLIVNNGGNVPPIVNIISPIGGTVSGNVTIRGTAHDLDGDETVASVQVKIDENWEYTDGTTDWSYSWNTTTLDDGNYTIYVRAFDGADYSMIKSVDVYVDNPHKPILTITSEIPETISGTITIEGTASDADGEVTKIEIQIDNKDWKEVEGTTDWSYKLDTTKLSDGKHTVKIRVYDDEGEYYEETFNINVNNSVWPSWLLLIIAVILLVNFLIIGIALKKKKAKPGGNSVPSQQPAQTETQTFRCPQCNNVFDTLQPSANIQCPYCGLSGAVK